MKNGRRAGQKHRTVCTERKGKHPKLESIDRFKERVAHFPSHSQYASIVMAKEGNKAKVD